MATGRRRTPAPLTDFSALVKEAPVYDDVDKASLPHPDAAYAALGYSAADEGVYVSPSVLSAARGARLDFGNEVLEVDVEPTTAPLDPA